MQNTIPGFPEPRPDHASAEGRLGTIEVESAVDHEQVPWVIVSVGDAKEKLESQLPPTRALEFAQHMILAAEGCQADAFLAHYFTAKGLPWPQVAQLIKEYRNFRLVRKEIGSGT